jgi:hypothetical protein
MLVYRFNSRSVEDEAEKQKGQHTSQGTMGAD